MYFSSCANGELGHSCTNGELGHSCTNGELGHSCTNGELGHSGTKVMESRLYDSRDRDHVNII